MFVPSGAFTLTSNSASSTCDGMNSCRTARYNGTDEKMTPTASTETASRWRIEKLRSRV